MDTQQHGGRAGRSTLSQLILHHDQILQAMEEGSNVDAVYLDFAKAFDKVDHGLLLHKLKKMGVKGKLGRQDCYSEFGSNKERKKDCWQGF